MSADNILLLMAYCARCDSVELSVLQPLDATPENYPDYLTLEQVLSRPDIRDLVGPRFLAVMPIISKKPQYITFLSTRRNQIVATWKEPTGDQAPPYRMQPCDLIKIEFPITEPPKKQKHEDRYIEAIASHMRRTGVPFVITNNTIVFCDGLRAIEVTDCIEFSINGRVNKKLPLTRQSIELASNLAKTLDERYSPEKHINRYFKE